MPPPQPYGPAGRRPPPRKRGGGRFASAIVVLLLIVTSGLIRVAVRTGFDTATHSGDHSNYTYAPKPGPDSTGVDATSTNPLLAEPGSPLSPANCPYSPWSTQADVARKFFESAATCLANAWQPVLQQAGLPFTAPKLMVSASTSGITTPCSGSSSNFAAFYCGADQTIYMPISQLQTDMFGDHWEVYLSVFAHEYGHHIQALSGILGAANKQRRQNGLYSSQGLELSRRVELQANCFDGMYFASSAGGKAVTPIQAQNARKDAYGRGDTASDMRDHGTPEHAGDWWSAGFDKNATAQCNTFTAPSGQVG
ncbi:neutral zinc metallopeptidase [Nocardia nova]|uniref:neutral zinc metallopeptidase n=1 Tax=Nocardia nova TaxID=37330 RepID=UPI0033C72CB1